MERSLCLAFTTLTIFAPLAQAAHPKQAVKPEGTASRFEFVATEAPAPAAARPGSRGYSFARQVLAAQPGAAPCAQSRVIYLNRDGAILRPGNNDSTRQISSIVGEPTAIDGLDVDDATWNDVVACVTDLYAPFDVAVTDQDPGNTPHIEAVFGGGPAAVGLPDNVAGVSPFTEDCSIIENSIAFVFTDLLPDARTACEVAAQEIAHSFGLDHEMLASDPMTYLDYTGDRTFKDRMVACGEYADRPCGINGSTCRPRQNSVAVLTERLGARGSATGGPAGSGTPGASDSQPAGSGIPGGCTVAGGSPPGAMALALYGVLRRRRRR